MFLASKMPLILQEKLVRVGQRYHRSGPHYNNARGTKLQNGVEWFNCLECESEESALFALLHLRWHSAEKHNDSHSTFPLPA
jgi:hypothetical protein